MTKAATRFRVAKLYAQQRLKDEEKAAGRGFQAKMARKLDTSTAHIANLINDRSLPGEEMMAKLAEHWHMTLDQLIAKANNDPISIKSVKPDRYAVMQTIRDAALADGYDPEFVAKFEVMLDFDGQPRFSDLWPLIVSAYTTHRQGKPAVEGDPLADLERPPSRRAQSARKKR